MNRSPTIIPSLRLLHRSRYLGYIGSGGLQIDTVNKLYNSKIAMRYSSTKLPCFATVDPWSISSSKPGKLENLVGGKWITSEASHSVLDPLNGEVILKVPSTQTSELNPYVESIYKTPKSGTHNVFKHPERFQMYGQVNRAVAEALHQEDIFQFFVKCIQRVMPKSQAQAAGEVTVVRRFFENFSGDNVRLMMRSFEQAGDYEGQISKGYRWPYGAVAVISPFNFPLEIPVMQFMAAAMVGNHPIVKPESRVGLPVEQFLRLLHWCGLPPAEIDLLNCRGGVMEELIKTCGTKLRMVQFTGGASAATKVIQACGGRVKLEDAGFDWKLLGPLSTWTSHYGADEMERLIDYVAWQCDQDAYSLSGQKCSAQSVALVHEEWIQLGLLDKIRQLAQRRSLSNMTLSPVMSHSNQEILDHMKRVLDIKGSRLLFGGKPLTSHSIPHEFGAFEPTAIQVDLNVCMANDSNRDIVTTELFGPFQIVISWKDSDLDMVLAFLESMEAHLTAAVVSNDTHFVNKVLGSTVNGTTYVGSRARTTGAPQNHWFGPAGNPMGAGIGTPEAIQSTWTCHREIIADVGPVSDSFVIPAAT